MYQLSKKFPQKRAFITGTASGLGRALSLALANDGWTIGISDIDMTGLQHTADMITQAGGKYFMYALDVADADNYKTVAEKFLADAGGIDLLVNNAGVGDGGEFDKYALENWRWMVGINQMGVVYGCHYFIPAMKQAGAGHIINIASAAAFVALPAMAPYNVTKAAVLSLSETLYSEYKYSNIGVSVVMPTFFKTNIMQHSKGTADEKEMGEMMVATSGLEAENVANRILKSAGNGKFYIVLPAQSYFLYLLKRFAPSVALWLNALSYEHKEKMRADLKKKYEKLKTGSYS
jgi:short-subunit dehydrogenase